MRSRPFLAGSEVLAIGLKSKPETLDGLLAALFAMSSTRLKTAKIQGNQNMTDLSIDNMTLLDDANIDEVSGACPPCAFVAGAIVGGIVFNLADEFVAGFEEGFNEE